MGDTCNKCGADMPGDGVGCANPNCLREWFVEIEAKFSLSGIDDITEEETGFLIRILRKGHDQEVRDMKILALAQQDSARYYQLLREVGNKHPGESRHDTALRYLRKSAQDAEE